jgi:LPXTG-motif cell wall-anchored protein
MSDLQDSDNQLEGFEEGPAIPPEKPPRGGRPFVVAITIIGALLVIALIALGVVLLSRNPAANIDQAARINAQNTQIALAATEQMRAANLQQTVNAGTQPSATVPPTLAPQGIPATNTPVVAIPTATNTPVPPTATLSAANQTATAIALGTKPANGTPQVTPTGGLPHTGIGDQVGLPGMIGLAVLLLAVILIVRRMRVSTSG